MAIVQGEPRQASFSVLIDVIHANMETACPCMVLESFSLWCLELLVLASRSITALNIFSQYKCLSCPEQLAVDGVIYLYGS